MLNDLLSIERGMAAHGIGPAGRHPDIKDMAKGPAFRVRLSSGGAIHDVHLVPDAGRGALWTLRDGQHNGFPGLKTAAGLLFLDLQARTDHQQLWDGGKAPAARRVELLRILATAPIDAQLAATWPSPGHRARIAERLASLQSLAGDPSTAAVPAAFERFVSAVGTTPTFVESLVAALATIVRDRGDDWLEPVRAALLGSAALFIDVPDTEFARDAGDPRQIEPVSAALSASESARTPLVGGPISCALSGKTGNLHQGNFPQPNLPGLGQTYIFARNRDIPSLTRYGRTADASFPIDSELARRLSGTISALTHQDAKGRSWRLIPAETGDKPDLLVTSLADARLADMLAGEDDDEEVDGRSAWGELGRRLIQQTHGGDPGEAPLEHVVILVLRTVDPANRKAIYQRNTTSAEIWKAAQSWQPATANTPNWLGFWLPVKGERKSFFRTPPFVEPLSITPLSRVQFVNGGRRRLSVIGVTAANAFGLFLGEGDVDGRAQKVLHLLLQRHGTLLSSLGAARIKGTEYLKDFDPKTDLRRDGLRSATWIGALLFHLGRLKEVYMSDVGFRLGQLLAAADAIHVGYCADLRGGDVPMGLIGNSVLTIAGADPKRALAILESRLKPYLAWAKREERLREKMRTLKTQEPTTPEQKKMNRLAQAIAEGFYTAPRIKTLADQLRPVVPLEEKGDAFKAELLLGYLAGLPRAAKPGSNLATNGNGSDQEAVGAQA